MHQHQDNGKYSFFSMVKEAAFYLVGCFMVWGVFPCTPQWAVSAEWWGGLYQGKKCTGNAQKCAESALYPALPNLLHAANVNRECTDGKGIPEEKEEEDGQGEGSWVVQHESGRGMVRKKMGEDKEDA